MSGITTVVPAMSRGVPVASGAGLTHKGRIRSRNEDAILTDPSGFLWAVADGMGGHGNGDVAADIVIDHLGSVPDDAAPGPALAAAIEAANAAVLAHAAAHGKGTMGATVVAVMIVRAIAHVAWVGDSRAYLLRAGRLRQLTRDHTFVQALVDAGQITPEEAGNHPESHVVTRAVGGGPEIEIDSLSVPLYPGDRLLLCSDGLPRCVYDSTIEQLLRQAADPDEACRLLLTEALESGAPDNVSAIVVDIRES
ncbi:MAG: protein phosphatase 2C domain-containing protein [Rhodobacteraceae bacterium]|nr:protein phosphatase 2C domain-containing protein [Paracoccaceae bacterium]